MSFPVARCCRQAFATTRRVAVQNASRTSSFAVARRWEGTDAAAAAPASTNPKITQIVDQIAQLNLLETADLVASLKSKLNIPDLPVGGGFAAPAQAAPAAVEEEEAAPAAAEKTLFNIKLESIEGGSKPKIIKEIKSMLGLSLVDSKKFVESTPKMMKESIPKDEAEKIIETMKALGAKAVME
ncbi:hypothetical protein KEM56_007865 [Ascosphaera pollenicola]|nr:hypothetical protein KEM56_007865 [Ascosphaera pollenicola]